MGLFYGLTFLVTSSVLRNSLGLATHTHTQRESLKHNLWRCWKRSISAEAKYSPEESGGVVLYHGYTDPCLQPPRLQVWSKAHYLHATMFYYSFNIYEKRNDVKTCITTSCGHSLFLKRAIVHVSSSHI